MGKLADKLLDSERGMQKREEAISKLKKGDRDIGIYGAGVYADIITNLLRAEGVNIDFYVVDLEYYNPKNGGVLSFEQMAERHPNAYIIPGIYILGFDEWDSFMTDLKDRVPSTVEVIEIGDYDIGSFEEMRPDYIRDHIEELQNTYDYLEDELSRKVMTAYLNSHISHDVSNLRNLWTSRGNDYEMDLLFNNLSDGAIIECGAFNGKSAVEMDDYLKGEYTIYALECDNINFQSMKSRVKGRKNIRPQKYAAWSCKTKLSFSSNGDASHVNLDESVDKNDMVDAIDIDSLIKEKVSIITMDVEGAEMQALCGAAETIKRYKPRIAVRVYHKKDDLITIPLFLRSINPEYKLYLRYNFQGYRNGTETTLYAL